MKIYPSFIIFFVVSCGQSKPPEPTSPKSNDKDEIGEKTPSKKIPTVDDPKIPEDVKKETGNQGGDPVGSLQDVVKTICSTTPGDSKRSKALAFLEAYKPGSRPFAASDAAKGKTQCVDSLLPAAIYTNLISGVPAGTLVGQAVQETGFCTSELAKNALNYHGQKATLKKDFFTYWSGEFYRKSSSESVTGSGNNVVSNFMKFKHADFSFVSFAERFLHPDLQVYKPCMAKRAQPEEFMKCVGSKWAVHGEYTKIVLNNRKTLKLDACEIPQKEWRLTSKFK